LISEDYGKKIIFKLFLRSLNDMLLLGVSLGVSEQILVL